MLFWTLCLEVKQDNVKQTAKSFVPFFCCVSPSSLNNLLAVGSNLVVVIPGGITSTKIVTNSQRANITKNEHLHNAISYISVFSAGTLRSRTTQTIAFLSKHQFLQTFCVVSNIQSAVRSMTPGCTVVSAATKLPPLALETVHVRKEDKWQSPVSKWLVYSALRQLPRCLQGTEVGLGSGTWQSASC